MRRWTLDVSALILRVTAGLIFVPHGWSKVFGEGGAAAFAADMAGNYGIPTLFGYVAAWAEVAGGVLLIAGLLTRVDALLLSATMGVAAFVVQLPDALFQAPPGAIRGFVAIRGIETPLAMLAICLALLFMGAGRVSLDHALRIEQRFLPRALAHAG